MRPKVGHIQFLNCLPIYHGLVEGNGILDLDLVKGTPTELNALLLAGDLDISPISSVEYARYAEDLLLLPGPTVSCRGPVQSILLFSRTALDDLHGRPIGLTAASATSQVLLRILMSRRYGVKPDYFTFAEEEPALLEEADAALLIGDRALEHHRSHPDLTAHDLGEEWFDFSKLGMVFAVWAVRREFAARHPGLVRHVWRLFQESLEYCTANMGLIAREAARWERYPAPFLEEYFRTLSFGFEEDLRRGLRFFLQLATETGDLEEAPEFMFFCPDSRCGVTEPPMVLFS